MPIVYPVPEPGPNATEADEPGIGCYLDHIAFTLPNGQQFVLDVEKDLATQILRRNSQLKPAIVFMPCRLSPVLIYAQCSFDRSYKEASGLNNFLRKGRIVNYMRKHRVASLIAVTPQLAEALYSLGEPRIEESLYLLPDINETPVRYELLRSRIPPQVLAQLQQQTRPLEQRPLLWRRILAFFGY